MYKHHQAAIDSITAKLKAREEVLGVIIGGSIAHGYANEDSDIDIMIVLSEENYKQALSKQEIGYFETESCAYAGGYVDGKYVSAGFIRKVAELGSEPAKYAFKDAFVTYSKVDGLAEMVQQASSYPIHHKGDNLVKFYAQFETWKWYYYEGLKRNNRLLIDYSLTNYVMFAGRMILAFNETLFPSYKWLLQELEHAACKPEPFLRLLNDVITLRTPAAVEALYETMTGFHSWGSPDMHWTDRFMLDSQLNWMEGVPPVLDL